MSAAHTAGPWFLKPMDSWTARDRNHIQFGRFDISAGSDRMEDGHYYRIASVSNVNNSLQNEANARLIAAAPDLLSGGVEAAGALLGAVKIMRELGHDRTAAKLDELLLPLIQALHKATGEPVEQQRAEAPA